eukprot:3538151-Prymnesium_polylepis.1
MECASDAVSTATAPSSSPATPVHEQEGGQSRRVGRLLPGLGLTSHRTGPRLSSSLSLSSSMAQPIVE